ncbi:MAG: hypothetical protein LRY55_06780 [Leadbetterella sp.]|nr:hypothetical protein [Leadbetterella sp.]
MKTMTITRSNFHLWDGTITTGKKYRFRDCGRFYLVLLHDCWKTNGLIYLKIEVLESSPKPYSLPAGKILEVCITEKDIFFQGMWYLYDL